MELMEPLAQMALKDLWVPLVGLLVLLALLALLVHKALWVLLVPLALLVSLVFRV